MVKAEAVSLAGDKYIGTPYTVMDCQAFVEKCLADAGIRKNLAGSNAWYREMTIRISPEECVKRFGEIPVGAFLFIVAEDGGEPAKYHGDRMGNASHIGIYTRRGLGALHSSASRGEVCESKFSGRTIRGGWNMVGLWDQLWYDNLAVQTQFHHPTQPDEDPKGEPAAGSWTVTAPSGGTVNLRASASLNAAVLERVPVGTQVQAREYNSDWMSVSTGGHTGYMMRKFLAGGGAPAETYRVTAEGVTWEQYKKILAICPMAEAEKEQ